MRFYFNILLAMTGCLLFEADVSGQNLPSTPAMDPDTAEIFSNAPPPPLGFTSKEDCLNSFTKQKDLLDAYHAGKISKEEAMIASERLEMALENKASMDIYGKVVDQNGQPVAGAEVQASIDKGVNLIDAVSEEHQTKTDAQGLFHFLGLHGQGMGIRLQKEGYNYDANLPSERPSNYLPDPNTPLIFTMWKLRGAEPMVHDKKFYGINPDGRIFTIDLVNKKKIEGTNAVGDLRVQIQRPAKIKSGEKFDWSLVITAIGGGVIAVTNASYLYEAPESGYQQTYELHMSAAAPNWQEQIERIFYIKSRDGKVFGHFHVNVIPNYNNTSVFDVESYVNPAGSRNLEFDPSKQIRQ